MGYCTIDDLRRILPEKVSIGDRNIGQPVPGRPSSGPGSSRSNITPEEAQHYIQYAQQYIDARLRPFYACPLRRIKSFETELLSDVAAGTSVRVLVHDSGPFSTGDTIDSNNLGGGNLVRLQDMFATEECTVQEVNDLQSIVLASVTGSYDTDGGRISILEYPDPIPMISARFACSFLLDRLYTAEQSPDVSHYGKTQRNIARNAMDDILSGEVLLFGQEHTGRRFVRGSLFDAYKSPADVQKGEEKE